MKIGAGHHVPRIQQHFGDAAHAGCRRSRRNEFYAFYCSMKFQSPSKY
jgi:hypothetical protein